MKTIPEMTAFRELYKKLGLLDDNGRNLALHEVCENHEDCWSNAEERKPPADKSWSGISQPYVGKHYNKYRILILGINMHEWGGLNELNLLAKKAMKLILDGKTRIKFGDTEYPGSFLWHRMGTYAHVILESKNLKSKSSTYLHYR